LKKEYDLKTLKTRNEPLKVNDSLGDIMVSVSLDTKLIISLKEEAFRLGIGYQSLIGSILHRYVTKELVDKEVLETLKDLK